MLFSGKFEKNKFFQHNGISWSSESSRSWYRSTYKGFGDEKMRISGTRMSWKVASIFGQIFVGDCKILPCVKCVWIAPNYLQRSRKNGSSFHGLVIQLPKERSQSHVLGVSWVQLLGFLSPLESEWCWGFWSLKWCLEDACLNGYLRYGIQSYSYSLVSMCKLCQIKSSYHLEFGRTLAKKQAFHISDHCPDMISWDCLSAPACQNSSCPKERK